MIFFLVKDLDLILHTWIQHGPWWTCRAWKSTFLGFLLSFSFFFSAFPKHDHMRLIINLWQYLNELLISVQRKVQLQEHQKISCQGSLLSRPYILLQSHSTAFFLEKSWCQTGICSMWDFFFLCVYINLLYLHCNCRISFLVYLHFRVSIQQQNSTVQQELSVDARYM